MVDVVESDVESVRVPEQTATNFAAKRVRVNPPRETTTFNIVVLTLDSVEQTFEASSP